MSGLSTLTYDERYALAESFVIARFEERDNFISDSDLLDAADAFTTSDMEFVHLDCMTDVLTDEEYVALTADWARLQADLCQWIESQS